MIQVQWKPTYSKHPYVWGSSSWRTERIELAVECKTVKYLSSRGCRCMLTASETSTSISSCEGWLPPSSASCCCLSVCPTPSLKALHHCLVSLYVWLCVWGEHGFSGTLVNPNKHQFSRQGRKRGRIHLSSFFPIISLTFPVFSFIIYSLWVGSRKGVPKNITLRTLGYLISIGHLR